MSEVSSAYKLFWVGKAKAEGSVGFAVKNTMSNFFEFPSSVNVCTMKLRMQLQCGRYAPLFPVHVPNFRLMRKLIFYEALRTATVSMPNNEKFNILGNFNVRFDRNFEMWNDHGPYGIV